MKNEERGEKMQHEKSGEYFFSNDCQRFFWKKFAPEIKLKQIDIILIFFLITYADKSNICYPGLDTICEKLGISRPTLISALKRLEGKKLIKITKDKITKTKNKPNLYDLSGFKKKFFEEYLKSSIYIKKLKTKNDINKENGNKDAKLSKIEKTILKKWNSLGIVEHKKTPPDYKGVSFNSALKKLISEGYSEKEIVSSMETYKEILESSFYWWTYEYEGLTRFLADGFYKFCDKENAMRRYKNKQKKQTQGIYDPNLKFDVEEYYVDRQDDFKEG